MRRTCVFIVVSLLGLLLLDGVASAAPAAGKIKPYREAAKGVVVSTTPNITTTTSRVSGTPIRHGTGSGSTAGSTPPPCGMGAGSPINGSATTVANTGDNLYNTFSGTLCQSSSTPTSATYVLTATFTITGGTGRFLNATGGGSLTAVATLFQTPQGSQGPFTSHSNGTIQLAG